MTDSTPQYLTEVADFVGHATFADLPGVAVERAKLVVADCVAAVVGGAAEPEMQALTERMLADGATGPATVFGPGLRTDPARAAFLNGTAGTFLEMDEGNQFARGHPGIHVVPAVLALAEAHGARDGDAVPWAMDDILLAIALGYEIGSRIGIACKLRMSMHPHGTWGTVGAAVALAKLKGWETGRIVETINVASSLGLATSRKTMLEGGLVRNSYSGVSNQMGFLACDLVASGFTGEADGLATIYGRVVSESFDEREMTVELGSRWEIARNYFKRHSCCRYNHGALDALAQITDRQSLRAPDIDRVEVRSYSLAAELSDPNPKNTLAAKFSLPFAIASTIVHGDSGVASFTWDAVRNDQVQGLAARVTVTEDPALTAKMPEYRPAAVVVHFKDGTTAEAETLTNKGDSEDPYDASDLREKFDELTTRLWTSEQARDVYDCVMNGAGGADDGSLQPLLSALAAVPAVLSENGRPGA